jgi:hypothetical protein
VVPNAGVQLIGGPQLSNRRLRLSWSGAKEQKGEQRQRQGNGAYKERLSADGGFSSAQRQAVRVSPRPGLQRAQRG